MALIMEENVECWNIYVELVGILYCDRLLWQLEIFKWQENAWY